MDTVAAMLKGSSNGPVIVRGAASQSLILKRVTASDPNDRMPPEHEGQPFTEAQVKLLSDWIAAGAPAPAEEKGEAASSDADEKSDDEKKDDEKEPAKSSDDKADDDEEDEKPAAKKPSPKQPAQGKKKDKKRR